MAGYKRAAIVADGDEQFDTGDLLRLTVWGLAAVAGVAAAVFVARTELGIHRARAALMAIAASPEESAPVAATQLLSRTALAEREARRALETVQAYGADRERMVARVTTAEREIADLNGSVQRALVIAAESKAAASQVPSINSASLLMQPKNPASANWSPLSPVATATEPPKPAPPAPAAAPVATAERAPEPAAASKVVPLPRPAPAAPPQQVAAANPQKAAPESPPPDESTAQFTGSVGPPPTPPLHVDFGVDLGPALTMTRLRARWTKLANEKPELVKGLRPLVTVREIGGGKPVEIRLVVGPLANVAAASEFCSGLVGAQYVCRPAVYDGQRLAVQ